VIYQQHNNDHVEDVLSVPVLGLKKKNKHNVINVTTKVQQASSRSAMGVVTLFVMVTESVEKIALCVETRRVAPPPPSSSQTMFTPPRVLLLFLPPKMQQRPPTHQQPWNPTMR
jgi:hypothetical protein